MTNRLERFILIFIPLIAISLFFRFFAFSNHINMEIEEMAKKAVLDKTLSDVKKNADASFPSLSNDDRIRLAKTNTLELFRSNPEMYKHAKGLASMYIKKNSMPALTKNRLIEADSYYYLGLTKNLIKTGKLSDLKIRNGLYFNRLMLAPFGNYYYFDAHPYVSFIIYKVLKIFDKKIDVVKAVALVSPILTIIPIIVFIWFLLSENLRTIAVASATLFFSAAPIFFQRSLYGWFDTDIYNIIFPLCIITLLLRSADMRETIQLRQKFAVAAGIMTGLYPLFWTGWIYILFSSTVFFALAYGIIYGRFGALNNSSGISNQKSELSKICGLYFMSVFIVLLLSRGPGGVIFSLSDTLSRLKAFVFKDFNLWPDAFLTVGELKRITLAKILVLSGGRIFAVVALFGLIALFLKKARDCGMRDGLIKGAALLAFTLIPFIMSIQAERFTILLVAPLSLCFAYALGFVFDFFSEVRSRVINFFLLLVFLTLNIVPVFSMFLMSSRKQPVIFNATWDDMMKYINKETPQESIINTYWSPGHFITGIAERRVTYDGATLEKPVGYWVSKALLSDDDKKAAAIFRMLNLSGNRATEYLVEKGMPLSRAVGVLDNILPLPLDQALEMLLQHMKHDNALELLKLTHGAPAPGYALIYNDLVEKAIGIQFMGNWDFKKAEDFDALRKARPEVADKILTDKLGNNYVRFLWSISNGPNYCEEPSKAEKRSGDTILFSNGLTVNLKTKTVGFADPLNKLNGYIKSLVYLDQGEVKENVFDNNGRISVFLKGNSIITCDRQLARSVMFRLFYYGGAGLDHFKAVHHSESSQDKTDLILYSIVY